jgi:hypothetical protein
MNLSPNLRSTAAFPVIRRNNSFPGGNNAIFQYNYGKRLLFLVTGGGAEVFTHPERTDIYF